jgi:hypothetical protein
MRILRSRSPRCPLHGATAFAPRRSCASNARSAGRPHVTTPPRAAHARQEAADGWTFHRTEASRGWLSPARRRSVPRRDAEAHTPARRLIEIPARHPARPLPVLTAPAGALAGTTPPCAGRLRYVQSGKTARRPRHNHPEARATASRERSSFALRQPTGSPRSATALRREICARGVAGRGASE